VEALTGYSNRSKIRKAHSHSARYSALEVAGRGANLSYPAQWALSAGSDDADAELIMRMPWKVVIGDQRHRLNARDR
jgi:hypothetical protein